MLQYLITLVKVIDFQTIYKDELVGVAIIGRPIARKIDQKVIAEVLEIVLKELDTCRC